MPIKGQATVFTIQVFDAVNQVFVSSLPGSDFHLRLMMANDDGEKFGSIILAAAISTADLDNGHYYVEISAEQNDYDMIAPGGTVDGGYTIIARPWYNDAADIATVKAKTDLIISGSITIVNPVSVDGGTLYLNIGDVYTIANGHPLTWTGSFPSGIQAAMLTVFPDNEDYASFFVQSSTASPTSITFELTAMLTNLLQFKPARLNYSFSIRGDEEFTEIKGAVVVSRVK